jgi:hypothetical protein
MINRGIASSQFCGCFLHIAITMLNGSKDQLFFNFLKGAKGVVRLETTRRRFCVNRKGQSEKGERGISSTL